MPGTRVLLLGATGVDKPELIRQFASWCAKQKGPQTSIKVIDFERDHVAKQRDGDLSQFLDDTAADQLQDWRSAW